MCLIRYIQQSARKCNHFVLIICKTPRCVLANVRNRILPNCKLQLVPIRRPYEINTSYKHKLSQTEFKYMNLFVHFTEMRNISSNISASCNLAGFM